MLIRQKGSKDSFYNAVLYALVFKMSKKIDFVTDGNKIDKTLGSDTCQKFEKIKQELGLTFGCQLLNNNVMISTIFRWEKNVFKSV